MGGGGHCLQSKPDLPQRSRVLHCIHAAVQGYIKENVSNPRPKQRILTDLTTFITQWRNNNNNSSVIVMLDANGDDSDSHFSTVLADTDLHDGVTHHMR